MKEIATIINYCSNEEHFIDACISQASFYSDMIVVSYGSHLYNGIKENSSHIKILKTRYPFVKFVEYPVNIEIDLKKQKGVVNRPYAYWHNLARWYGFKEVPQNFWVLFLDVDEVPDGLRFREWWRAHTPQEDMAFKLANYWYFKKPIFQAQTWEDTPALVHARKINEDNIFGDRERDHTVYSHGLKLNRYVLGNDFKPLIHHFSWVRSPEQMLFKLKNWGHQTDFANHDGMVAHIFRDDGVNDIVHGYQYSIVPNKFEIRG